VIDAWRHRASVAFLLGGIPLSVVALANCGGTTGEASSPAAETTPSQPPTTRKSSDYSLETLREKLHSGLGAESELNLAAKGLGPELGTLLSESTAIDRLTELDVSDNDLGVDGARALARSPHLSSIRDLDLGGNDIGDDGVDALAHAVALGQLETLNLSGNSITGRGASALVGGGSARLGSLDLSMNAIGSNGASALAHSKLPLRSVYLLGCEIGASGAKELSQSKGLSQLTVLALSGNSLGDEGVQALAKSTAFQNLGTLDLCANGVSDVGALALAQSSHLKKLKVLELFGNSDIGPKGSAALRKRFGGGLHL